MERKIIPSAIEAGRAEVLSDMTSCHVINPSRSSLQKSVYQLRAEIDAGNRIIQEQARRIEELTLMLRRENDMADEAEEERG